MKLCFKHKQTVGKLLRQILDANIIGGRCPHSIICVVIFIVVRTFKPIRKLSLKDISEKVDIAVNTSTHCLHNLLQHKTTLMSFFEHQDTAEKFKTLCKSLQNKSPIN